MSLPEVIVPENRRKVAAIAQEMLEGPTRIVDGALALDSLRHRVGLDEFDSDFLPFLNFADEVDHLPVGGERRFWAADILPRKEAELAEREAAFREDAFAACRRLIARFGEAVSMEEAHGAAT
jgi:hypothetical protein